MKRRMMATKTKRKQKRVAPPGDFYRGMEWFACWLLDHAEGEIIMEELLRGWVTEAWCCKEGAEQRLERDTANDQAEPHRKHED